MPELLQTFLKRFSNNGTEYLLKFKLIKIKNSFLVTLATYPVPTGHVWLYNRVSRADTVYLYHHRKFYCTGPSRTLSSLK